MRQDSTSYPAYDSENTAEEIIKRGLHFDSVHNTYLITRQAEEETPPGHDLLKNPLHEFKTLTLNSNLVVIATPISRNSALTASHKFIFSDYEARVSAIYKDQAGSIQPGTTIIVSRPGGNVQVGDAAVRAIETEFPLFHLGEKYLLFLHELPSGSFRANPSDCYLLEDGAIKAVRNHPKTDLSFVSPRDVLDEVRAAVANDRRVAR